jgi:hypothetical protein
MDAVQNSSDILVMSQRTDSATGFGQFYMQVNGTKTAGVKPFTFDSYQAGGTGWQAFSGSGRYKGTSAISSVTITSSSGNFTAGTIYVFGA